MNARDLFKVGGAALAIFVAPGAASAQQTLEPVRVTAMSRAEQLEMEADALPTEVGQFKRAAKLFEQAAAARPDGDAEKATALRKAAYLRYYSGDTRASGRLMEKAAEQSVVQGDVATAANAFIDAALIANERTEIDRALVLGRRAETLVRSPRLDETQRARLMGRIAGWNQIAMNYQK